jgi:hypothetical protein
MLEVAELFINWELLNTVLLSKFLFAKIVETSIA